MSDKLKPCPFCGGEAVFVKIVGLGVKVVCKNCWNESKFYYDAIDAIDAWNRRAKPTFTPDEIDAIRRNVCDWRAERELSKIEQSIIDKCAKALKGGGVE